MDYWPASAKIIQVDVDAKMLGLVKSISVGINGDARAAAAALLERLRSRELACSANLGERHALITAEKAAWERELTEWTHERDPFSLEVAAGSAYLHPRQMLRELERAMPQHAMVSTDIGNICSVSNSYLRFEEPRSMFAAMSFGNCGYAFPVACGAKVACPGRPAIAYVGDGAFLLAALPGGEPRESELGERHPGVRLRRRHRREAVRRRARVAGSSLGAGRGQDDRARDDGDAGTG
jgi:sulfoacetaldehyde acetyltransferase